MKNLSRCLALAAAVVFTSAAAFGWGNATHMYIADHLGASFPLQNTYELYGAVLPDLYTYSFDEFAFVSNSLLQKTGGTIMSTAWSKDLRSVGYGFLAHNELFGADRTAHLASAYAKGEGYMILKGAALGAEMLPTLIDIFKAGGIDEERATILAQYVAAELGHDLCETAVDILVKRQDDRLIGAKIAAAATVRPAETGKLLGEVFASDIAGITGLPVDAVKAKLATDEAAYRKQIQQYGALFCLPENTIVTQLGAQMAPIAEGFLEVAVATAPAELGLSPVDLTVTPAQVEGFIRKAMALTQHDYQTEVKATITLVGKNLKGAGITNDDPKFVFWKEGVGESTGAPVEFALAGNYPNPFNPTTTIGYAVAETRLVRLVVYDLLGREVATLVNEVKEPGKYTAVWNAGALASGLYICRMTSGQFVQSTRMILQK
jgi:hypothetical protein